MSKLDILANDIDDESVYAITEISDRIDRNSAFINTMANELVDTHCQPLNEYVTFIQGILKDDKHPPTSAELDDFVLNLPVLLYFCGEAQENLGIKTDVAKAVKNEKYNEIYKQVKGTIADKTAASELEAQSETITHIIYDRAYKICKEKMNAAYELLSSCKKVISRRISEAELANLDGGRIKNGR